MADYVITSPKEQEELLKAIGKTSLEDCFAHLPSATRLNRELDIPQGLTEFEVLAAMGAIAHKNKVYPTIFRGAGAYKHLIPTVVNHLSSRSEFVTSYTPYQAEISQGTLQAIFEYQTAMGELTGLFASNASVYDGATAAAEAMMMCQERTRDKILIADNINPGVMEVMKTYIYSFEIPYEIVDLNHLDGHLGDDVAGIYVEQLSYHGQIIDVKAVADIVGPHGIKLIMGVNPIAAAVLPSAAQCHADIAVGEGQPLGIPLGFGGPYFGFMCTTKPLIRRLPGRIVGETVDADGKKAYVLTLQAREQHIRREKALSSICSNQSLMALRAAIYCATVGKVGLVEIAQRCIDNSHYLATLLQDAGLSLAYEGPFFHEFVTTSKQSAAIIAACDQANILAGLPLNDTDILWCATEANTLEEMKTLARIVKEVLS